jgi:hypothetical protein
VAGDLVGGDAAMIELDQLVAGYEGLAITGPERHDCRQHDGHCRPERLRKIDAAENAGRVYSAGQRPPALAGRGR